MQAHLFPPSLPTLSWLAPLFDDHQAVSCLLLHLMALLDDIEPKHCALILVIRPLSTLPSRFLLLWLPKNWRAEQAGRCGRGLDDKGANTVRELNVVKECWEVEREMGCRMLLVRRWVNLEMEKSLLNPLN